MQVNTLSTAFLSLLMLFSISPSQAAILFSTDFQAWQADMTTTFSRQLDHEVFVTDYTNIATTVPNIFPALDRSDLGYQSKRMDWSHSANNVDLGRTAVFNSSDTRFKWSFEVSALESDTVTSSSRHYHGSEYAIGDEVEAHVIYNDRINRNDFDQVDAFTDVLSIGKFRGFDTDEVASGDPYSWDNDDFSIEITSGPALYAFAFEIVNNRKFIDTTFNGGSSDGGLYSYGRESISITDSDGETFSIQENTGELPIIPGYFNDPSTSIDEGKYTDNFDDVQFIGIVSDTPFSFLEFNEDSRSDDIGIKNLMFAGAASPVPVPPAVWLFVSGIVALLGLGQKRTTTSNK